MYYTFSIKSFLKIFTKEVQNNFNNTKILNTYIYFNILKHVLKYKLYNY